MSNFDGCVVYCCTGQHPGVVAGWFKYSFASLIWTYKILASVFYVTIVLGTSVL